jgi:hypothetical protein
MGDTFALECLGANLQENKEIQPFSAPGPRSCRNERGIFEKERGTNPQIIDMD